MRIVTDYISHDVCTGCGACMNICPLDAIKMAENEKGFIVPDIDKKACINCGRCLQVCPKHICVRENWSEPQVFAAYAKEEIQVVSSSGGIFSLLAKNMLEKEAGAVAGVVFDDNMQAVYTLAEKIEDVEPMRGSKYVQSNVGMIYRDIKKYLEEDRSVLFTGCPCQVAALKNFLGKDYNNLLTVDILCHGVPSNKTFQLYLNSISGNKKVKNVAFRDKQFGWNANHIKITFADDSTYIGDMESDGYVKGFLKNLFLRKSCEECIFSEFPRVGDITIGDFWGIRNISPEMYSALGTSMIFVNNEKGEKYYKEIKSLVKNEKRLAFQPQCYPNRIHRLYHHNNKRDQFFLMLKNKGFDNSIKYLLPEKGEISYRSFPEDYRVKENNKLEQHDIGLVCNYFAGNFGGSLTQYALYNVLKEMGYSVYMIEHPQDADARTSKDTLNKIYVKVPYPIEDMAPDFKNRMEMRKLNEFCDCFVVGSDQLFQYTLYEMMGKFVILDWVDDTKQKVAYAASFGHAHMWGKQSELGRMAYFIQRFDGFSVREKTAVEICKNQFDIDAEWVLDPVFLCDKQHFIDLADNADIQWKEHYIGSYLLDPDEEKREMLEFLMKNLGIECDIFSEFNSSAKYMESLGSLTWHNYKVEERLSSIMNCDVFFTDSFHGTCFSIIMKKPFVSVLNTKRGADRFTSLLEHFGLANRLIRNYDELTQVKDIMRIDYDAVYKILEQDKIRSYSWLCNRLQVKKGKSRSTYNILCDMIAERDEKIENLEKLVTCLSQELGYLLEKITDINRYLAILKKNRDKYVIFMAVKDTSGFLLDKKIADAIKRLGFRTDMQDKHWYSFIGIINEKKVICETLSGYNEAVTAELWIDEMKVNIGSKCLKAGNEAFICINEKNYAVNRRGLNIVVWDKESGCVIDSVCFDTHSQNIPCYR